MTDSAARALKNAYALLKTSTPIDGFDCGKICSAICCSGSENDGMFLFPYEEELIKGDNFTVCDAPCNYDAKAVKCTGICSRNNRPLACRMFPLFPVIYEGRIKVVVDPRASICPLACDDIKISRIFIRNVRRAGRYLAQDPDINKYLLEMSDEIINLMIFKQRLEK